MNVELKQKVNSILTLIDVELEEYEMENLYVFIHNNTNENILSYADECYKPPKIYKMILKWYNEGMKITF
jgi:hypothetical protein